MLAPAGRAMTYDYTARCPRCTSLDVYGFEPTITGQFYYCPRCSAQWRVTVEDKTLDMIGASLSHQTARDIERVEARPPFGTCWRKR
jgi:transposase-like protein